MKTLGILLGVAVLAACSSSAEPTPVSVQSGPNACDVAPTSIPAGEVVFGIQNSGQEPLSFTVTSSDGAVAAQITGVGEGEAKDLVAQLPAGSYSAQCQPGATTSLTVE